MCSSYTYGDDITFLNMCLWGGGGVLCSWVYAQLLGSLGTAQSIVLIPVDDSQNDMIIGEYQCQVYWTFVVTWLTLYNACSLVRFREQNDIVRFRKRWWFGLK